MKGLITTADDFGACDFIDRGIIEGIRHKKINTTSAFITHADSVSRIENLLKIREEGFQIKIGLHFSLTSGFSLLQKPSSLTSKDAKEGHFFRDASYYPFRKIKIDDFQQELVAQLKALDTVLGNEKIDHVSCHHGIINFDEEFYRFFLETIEHYCRLGSEKYQSMIPIRSPQPWSRSEYKEKLIYPIHKEGTKLGFWRKLPEALKFKEKYHATSKKTFTPNYLIDTIYGRPKDVNFDDLFARTEKNELTCELMFHLGTGENQTTEIHGVDTKYFDKRKLELETLKAVNFPFVTTFSDLSESSNLKTNEIS